MPGETGPRPEPKLLSREAQTLFQHIIDSYPPGRDFTMRELTKTLNEKGIGNLNSTAFYDLLNVKIRATGKTRGQNIATFEIIAETPQAVVQTENKTPKPDRIESSSETEEEQEIKRLVKNGLRGIEEALRGTHGSVALDAGKEYSSPYSTDGLFRLLRWTAGKKGSETKAKALELLIKMGVIEPPQALTPISGAGIRANRQYSAYRINIKAFKEIRGLESL